MKRRDFVKLFAVTPAVAAASKVLADIKEAEKPISKIISNPLEERDDTLIVRNITHYSMAGDNNLMFQGANDTLFSMQGRHQVEITSGIELWGSEDFRKLTGPDCRYIQFDYENLSDKRFMLSNFEIEASYGEMIAAEIQAVQVRFTNDSLVMV